MTEILFYHLEQLSWEQVLPNQLTRTLDRGWRAVVQTPNPDQLADVSAVLWGSEPQSFLAHGSKPEDQPSHQPIWLTTEHENLNQAVVRFYVNGATVTGVEEMQRVVILFDGRDEAAVAQARNDWRKLKTADHQISYWQQDENQRWVNRST